MGTVKQFEDNRTVKSKGIRSLFDTEVNIKIRVLTIIAIAGAVGNTLGFVANLFLYGFTFVTGFCAVCAVLIILTLLFGLKSKHGVLLGYLMLLVLDVFEFPLLTLAYGAVMYPYLIIGFHALVMIAEKSRRTYLALILGLYDILIVVYSMLHPYIFGPQEDAGLLGSAVSAFVITIVAVASLVIMWQNVYLVDTIEIDAITRAQSQVGFIKNAKKILDADQNENYCLLYFNVFSFKAINSIYGIEGGNRFLRSVAEHLTHSSLSPRLVGRLSADRFVCLVQQSNLDSELLPEICQIPFEENGRKVLVNLYCGIYEIKDKSLTVSSMIDRASAAIRFVHKSGNRHYAFYNSDVETTYNEETVVLGEIDKAISDGQFYPFYQPVLDCQTREIVSAEALARWVHPQMGIISPYLFIPVLEKKNLISNLDHLMAVRVNELIMRRTADGLPIVPIAINLSRDDLFDESLIRSVRSMMKEGSRLRFEITESAYEDMTEHMIKTLSELRKDGATILVDDFGKGSSTLGMITDYEYDIIKLDSQFAHKAEENEKIVSVIQSIIDMSHKLGAKVVAEGVETEKQYEVFKDCGCDYVQGFYFYKPMPANDFLALLK